MIKDELLAELHWSGAQAAHLLRSLAPEVLDERRHENGWTGRQILAHIASIEWTYPMLIELARFGEWTETSAAVDQFDVDAYNALQVEKRSHTAVPDLIAEFEKNRAITTAAVESCEKELMDAQVKSASGFSGPLGEVMHYLTVEHVGDHLAEIMGIGRGAGALSRGLGSDN